jgi:hypothetical protein
MKIFGDKFVKRQNGIPDVAGNLLIDLHSGGMLVNKHRQPQNQVDQIGRIFANCAIVFFGQFFENDKSSPKLSAIFSHCQSYV